jgi:hypothetical protein
MPKEDVLVATAFRIPKVVHDRVRRFRDALEKEQPGSSPSLSDAFRVLIVRGLGGPK